MRANQRLPTPGNVKSRRRSASIVADVLMPPDQGFSITTRTDHIREEETNVWGDVRSHFTDEQRMAMNRRYPAAKNRVRVP
jgi:hypothetical protein